MSSSQIVQEIVELEDSCARRQEELSDAETVRAVAAKEREIISELKLEKAESNVQIEQLQNAIIKMGNPEPEAICAGCVKTNESYFKLKEFCEELQLELEEARSQAAFPKEGDMAAELRVKELESDIEERNRRIEELSQEVQFLVSEVADLEPFRDHNEQLGEHILRLKDEEAGFIQQLSEQQMKLSGARSELYDSQEAASRCSTTATYAAEYEQLEELDDVRARLHSSEAEISEFKKQVVDLHANVECEAQQNNVLREEIASLKTSISEYKVAESSHAAEEAEITFLQTQLSSLRGINTELELHCQELRASKGQDVQSQEEDTISEQRQEISSMETTISQLKQQLIDQYITFTGRYDTISLENKELNADYSRLENQKLVAEEIIVGLKKANVDLEEKVAEAEENTRDEFQKASALAVELENGVQYIREMEEKNDSLEKDLQELLQSHRHSIDKIKQLTEENALADEELVKMRKEMQYLVDENRNLKEEEQIDQLLEEVQEEEHQFSENET